MKKITSIGIEVIVKLIILGHIIGEMGVINLPRNLRATSVT